MSTWHPISRVELDSLVDEDYALFSDEERSAFERHGVEPRHAIIRRSEIAGNEKVYVIWQKGNLVIYYDDVEGGFEFSRIDESGVLIDHYCNQNTLQGAMYDFLNDIESWVK